MPNPDLAPRGGASAGEGLGPDPLAEKPTWARAATVEPLAPARYKVQFTASVELRDKLLAEHDFGKDVMARHRRGASRVSEPQAVYGAG